MKSSRENLALHAAQHHILSPRFHQEWSPECKIEEVLSTAKYGPKAVTTKIKNEPISKENSRSTIIFDRRAINIYNILYPYIKETIVIVFYV